MDGGSGGRMRALLAGLCLLACAGAPALAEETCPGNPDAIGTSRTITVDPATLPLIGTIQYHATVPLNDHEVVLTFDDGPLPPYSERILDILKENCVKVTYFLVGTMARNYPWVVRRIYNDGHTIGTHSNNHPFGFANLSPARLEGEVDGGIASVQAAVGDAQAVSPYFRIPGLSRSDKVENYLESKSLAVWSADEVADDWFRGITPDQIVARAMRRIEEKDHRGVLLLHDIHPATVMALPKLLKELKEGGYRIVQVVAPGERPKSVPELAAPAVAHEAWPRPVKASATTKVHHAARVLHHKKKLRLARKHREAEREQPPVVSHVSAERGLWPHEY